MKLMIKRHQISLALCTYEDIEWKNTLKFNPMNKLSYNTFSLEIFGLITPQKKLWLFHSPGIPIEHSLRDEYRVRATKQAHNDRVVGNIDGCHAQLGTMAGIVDVDARSEYRVKILFMFPDRNREYSTIIDNKMKAFSTFLLRASNWRFSFRQIIDFLIFICVSSSNAFRNAGTTIQSTKMRSMCFVDTERMIRRLLQSTLEIAGFLHHPIWNTVCEKKIIFK